MVPGRGLEPPCLATPVPKTGVYTISPPGQMDLTDHSEKGLLFQVESYMNSQPILTNNVKRGIISEVINEDFFVVDH